MYPVASSTSTSAEISVPFLVTIKLAPSRGEYGIKNLLVVPSAVN
jgi:hypothetical protein